MQTPTLDAAVFPAAEALERSAGRPDALLWLGTGIETLVGRIEDPRRRTLGEFAGVPAPWRAAELVGGKLEGVAVWLLADAPGPLEFGEESGGVPPWARAFPCWLARAAGARVCLHTSSGVALRGPEIEEPLPIGALAAVSDHLNLSGRTPLLGMGATRLGPLFPDQSRVHDQRLRASALRWAASAGVELHEAVAACTTGPTLDTQAELAWLARTGARIAVQQLAGPLVACAHAGLSTLALVALTDDGSRPLELARLVDRAERAAPLVEDLVRGVMVEVARVAARQRETS